MTAAPAPPFVSCLATGAVDARQEIVAGLMQPRAAVSPKYLYDRLGSALFTAITELPEYYPTRTEAAIFQAHRNAIAAALPQRLTLVDLGAGDGAKAARMFQALRTTRYVAIDISEAYLRQALGALQQRFPALEMAAVGMDFARELALPAGLLRGPALVFYPGSSIGNFSPDEALRLLRQAHALAQGGALLIGADLHKPKAVLEAAYDDALGVTAAFNLNLLRHLNALIGSDFDVADWCHAALYDEAASRVEMHLLARRDVAVRWPGGGRDFRAGDGIHTENSYKWTSSSFEALLRDAGWRDVRHWTDAQGWFGVFTARAQVA
jgi:dimethylhistidine N-methyltransferase